ncbi:MAG: integrin alpha [Rickettsiales bacterium]|jgi:hypothetical protein|nr:integrin alpha [Rickettsiales bacterium]
MSHLVIDSLVQNNQAYLLKKYNVSDFFQSSDFIGDFNGDGIDDFVLSAPFQYSTTPGSDSKGYVIYGNIENALDFDNFTPNDGLVLITPSYNYTYEDDSYPYSDIDGFANGHTLSFAGDFNNDGYDDILVSIFYYNNTQGIHYLVYGGVYNSSSLYLEDVDSSRGFAIYGAENTKTEVLAQYIGDLNGDGVDDIAIHEASAHPTVSIIYGKNNAQDIYLNSLTSSEGFKIKAQDFLGYWRMFDTIGDINDDGFSDIAIAASDFAEDSSKVFVIFGSSMNRDIDLNMFNASIGYNITGFKTESMVRGLGDINGDNIPDMLIGSHNEGSNYQGRLYVIFGNSTNFEGFDVKDINDRGFIVSGKGGFDQVGEVISNGLDVNNDGFNDILIGSSNDVDGAYVIFGGTNTSDIDLGISSDRFLSIGMASGAEARSVNGAGDFNNDGYDDFVISYNFYDDNYNHIQEHYLVFDLYNTSRFATNFPSVSPTLSSTSASTTFCPSISPSVMSISPTYSMPTAIPTGFTQLTLSPTSALTFSDSVAQNIDLSSVYNIITGSNAHDNVGLSVDSAGDINGDGYDDIMLSSIYESSFAGKVYIIFGRSAKVSSLNVGSILETQGFSITGGSSYDYFGTTLSAAGDVNGDGYDDIIIGVPSSSSGDGKAYVVFGKASGFSDVNVNALSSTERFTIYGAQDSRCGSSVGPAGDVNGDGYDDIIIGASDSEQVYVIFGKSSGFSSIYLSSLSSSDGYIISGNDIGSAVSSAGDFNGDGYGDIIVGAGSSSPKYNNEGTSYILYGKASGYSNVDLMSITIDQGFYIIGDNYNDQSGRTVSSLGDFNNDGYDDVVIGAPFALSNKGKSYVIYGNKTINANIDLSNIDAELGMEIIGSLSNGNLGSSLSGAGDVNNDGYSDVIIGANSASPKSFHEGVSYVLFGHPEKYSQLSLGSLTEAQGYRLTGDNYNDVSGNDVGGGGDLNNDGYDDVIISAPFVDTGLDDNVGRVYIIYGSASSISREIDGGGVYIGTSLNEDFIIDSLSDVTLTGGKGNDLFTVKPNSNTQTIITDFDKDNERIDLSFFDNIQGIDDLTITSGSAMVNLGNDQTIRLLDLDPSDVAEDNFIFAQNNNDDNEDGSGIDTSNLIEYGILAGVGLVALTVLGCSGFAAYKCCCSNSNKGTVAPTYELA